MRCDRVCRQLAVYRELNARERAALDAHLAGCARCAAAFEAYRRQDRLFSDLPELQPPAGLKAGVLSRTTRLASNDHIRVRRSPAWASVVAVFLAVLIGGTFRATAQSLPGARLYRVKRAVEGVRISLIPEGPPRDAYRDSLDSKRVYEVLQLVSLGREAEVEFQGVFELVDDDRWEVDGVPIVPPPEADASPPQEGSVVVVRAQVVEGRVEAVMVVLSETPRHPVDTAAPVPPSPTASVTVVALTSTASPASGTPKVSRTRLEQSIQRAYPIPAVATPRAAAGGPTMGYPAPVASPTASAPVKPTATPIATDDTSQSDLAPKLSPRARRPTKQRGPSRKPTRKKTKVPKRSIPSTGQAPPTGEPALPTPTRAHPAEVKPTVGPESRPTGLPTRIRPPPPTTSPIPEPEAPRTPTVRPTKVPSKPLPAARPTKAAPIARPVERPTEEPPKPPPTARPTKAAPTPRIVERPTVVPSKPPLPTARPTAGVVGIATPVRTPQTQTTPALDPRPVATDSPDGHEVKPEEHSVDDSDEPETPDVDADRLRGETSMDGATGQVAGRQDPAPGRRSVSLRLG